MEALTLNQQVLFRAYLLGRMTPVQAEDFEETHLVCASAEQIRAARRQLAEAYAERTLRPAERAAYRERLTARQDVELVAGFSAARRRRWQGRFDLWWPRLAGAAMGLALLAPIWLARSDYARRAWASLAWPDSVHAANWTFTARAREHSWRRVIALSGIVERKPFTGYETEDSRVSYSEKVKSHAPAERRAALVIGVGVAGATKAATDALFVRRALLRHGYQVTHLLQEDATPARVREAIGRLAGPPGEGTPGEGTVVIYAAGHTVAGNAFAASGGALPWTTLAAEAARLPAWHVALWIDACTAEACPEFPGVAGEVEILSAGRALRDGRSPYGVFTGAILRQLRAASGVLTSGGLAGAVLRELPGAVRHHAGRRAGVVAGEQIIRAAASEQAWWRH